MVRVRVPVEYSQYWICVDDVSEDDTDAVDIADGLAQWQLGEVIVTAANEGGSVDVAVELLDAEPSLPLTDEWQDAVEFSLTTETGEIRLVPLMDAAVGPNLSTDGPGAYRFRLSAAGRDPIDGKKQRERHRLQVWPAPEKAPVALRLSSAFAAEWAAPPPPPKQIDGERLAATPGVRLIVGWESLQPPSGDPELLALTEVTVHDVVQGTPAQVFELFNNPVVGGIAGGMRSGGEITAEHPDFHCSILSDPPDDDCTEPTEAQRLIGALTLVGKALQIQRFHTLRFELGFDDGSLCDSAGRTGHPLPPGSTVVEMHFSKHADGREVSVTHTGIPAWLADDVAALWRFVLQQNKVYSRFAPEMPWSD
jgi:hypothetical protein